MSWSAFLLSAAAVAALLVLAWKLREAGARDPTAPPKPKSRRLSHNELDDMTELVGRGGEEEVLRRLKAAGYSEAQARNLVRLMTRVAEADRAAGA